VPVHGCGSARRRVPMIATVIIGYKLLQIRANTMFIVQSREQPSARKRTGYREQGDVDPVNKPMHQ
jgi:hypothetical protein